MKIILRSAIAIFFAALLFIQTVGDAFSSERSPSLRSMEHLTRMSFSLKQKILNRSFFVNKPSFKSSFQYPLSEIPQTENLYKNYISINFGDIILAGRINIGYERILYNSWGIYVQYSGNRDVLFNGLISKSFTDRNYFIFPQGYEIYFQHYGQLDALTKRTVSAPSCFSIGVSYFKMPYEREGAVFMGFRCRIADHLFKLKHFFFSPNILDMRIRVSGNKHYFWLQLKWTLGIFQVGF